MRSAQRPSSPSLNTMPDSSRSFAFSSIDQSYARDAGIEELLETIEKLTERQKLCVKTYQFKEAADIKQRIKELKKEVIVKRCLYIENRHTEEIQQIIEAQQEELRNFDEFWTQKINEYSTEAQELEQQILDKHAEDMEIMREELQETMPVKPIKSPKHLEYKTMIKSLAKTEDFLEADKFMKKVAEIEKQEWVKAETEKDKKIKLQLGQLSSQQRVEIASIKQKINAGSDKLVKIRDEERAKLQQKFKNMMQEIKMAQQLEISRFELKYKSYIPDEKLAITARKREGGKSFSKCLTESVFASTTSLTGWDKTASTSDLKAEKKVLAQQKKSLIETLCTNSIAGKTDRAASFKHRRTNSMQTMKI